MIAMYVLILSAAMSGIAVGLQSDRLRQPRPSLTPTPLERLVFVVAVILWIVGLVLLLFDVAAL